MEPKGQTQSSTESEPCRLEVCGEGQEEQEELAMASEYVLATHSWQPLASERDPKLPSEQDDSHDPPATSGPLFKPGSYPEVHWQSVMEVLDVEAVVVCVPHDLHGSEPIVSLYVPVEQAAHWFSPAGINPALHSQALASWIPVLASVLSA